MKLQLLCFLALTSVAISHPTPFHNDRLASYSGGPIYGIDGQIIGDNIWQASGASFDMDGYFTDNRCAVKKNDKWGFIDKNNDIIVQPIYEKVYSFRDGLAPVCLNGKWGYIDTSGKLAIPIEWDFASQFSEGAAAVVKEKKLGYINKLGKLGIPLKHNVPERLRNDTGAFINGMAILEVNGNYGCINKLGEVIVPYEYDKLFPFNDGLALAKKGEMYGYLDIIGNVAIDFRYSMATSFNGGLALVPNGETQGYINTKGKVVATSEWGTGNRSAYAPNYWRKTYHDRFPVRIKGKFGFMDSTGKVIIQPAWDETNGFLKSGFCCVQLGDKFGVIDVEGNYILPPEYDTVIGNYSVDMSEGMIYVRKGSNESIMLYSVSEKKLISLPKE